MAGLSLPVLVVGIVLCARAHTNQEVGNGVIFIVIGAIGLLLGLIVGFVVRQQTKAITAAAKGEGEIWARWTCSPEEAARFIAREQERLRFTSKLRWQIIGGALALGIVAPFIHAALRGSQFTLSERLLTIAIALVIASIVVLLAPRFSALALKHAIARANGESVISAEGILTGGFYYAWRSFNWGLRRVAFEPGSPSVIHFEFLAGTIVGSSGIKLAGDLAYILGEIKHRGGTTQSKEEVRVPVPQGREDEARQIVATLMGAPQPDAPAGNVPHQIKSSLTVTDKPPPKTMGLYLWINNEQQGPFEEADVRSRLASGALAHEDLVWSEGMTDWKSLREMYPAAAAPAAPASTGPSSVPASASTVAGVYLWKDDEQIGPFDEADIRDRIAKGDLFGDDLAWTEGMSDWQEMRQFYPNLSYKSADPPSPPSSTVTPAPPLALEPLKPTPPSLDPTPALPVVVDPPPPPPFIPPPPPPQPPLMPAAPLASSPSISARAVPASASGSKSKPSLITIASVLVGLLVIGLGVIKIMRGAGSSLFKKTSVVTSTSPSSNPTKVAEAITLYDNKQYPEALRIFQVEADSGNAEAQDYLGIMYQFGLGGLTKNEAEAAKWIRKAADQGYADAQFRLGIMYQNGLAGLTKDSVEAIKWYRKAVDQNNPAAQTALGKTFVWGLGVAKQEAEGARLIRLAADQGYGEAQAALGNLYLLGLGVPKNYAESLEWYQKAADQNEADGQVGLATLYKFGLGVTADLAQAVSWLNKAVEQGSSRGQAALGVLYMNGWGVKQDYAQAFELFTKSAAQDDSAGQFGLAWLYLGGKGVKQDHAEALTWMKKSADQDDDDGQFGLGLMYLSGSGVEKDYGKALGLFTKAAKYGHAEAECDLGVMYLEGLGVTANYAQALAWFTKATQDPFTIDGIGMRNAAFFLGHIYESGLGVAKDRQQALAWYRKAAGWGDEDAKKALARLGER